MYARHFALNKDPFSIAPDPRFLFMSDRHREALAHLLFGVKGTGGFVLFTGDIGTGKTTVCRCFLEQIPAGCNVAIVFNPKLSVLELLQTICEEFHVAVDSSASGSSLKPYVDALNVFLLQSHAAGQSNVLIIDEAQNLLPEVLEQLRLLTNLETHERKLLQIVLIGQPELRTMLERADLEQLAQRVIARYHLESLNVEEATRYIQHRLTVAGHSGPLPFDARALRRIYDLTRGVPRRINLLCGRVLLGAWANGLHRVDRPMVDKAAAEVFGADPAHRRWSSRSYAAPLLCLVGALCLVLALVLQPGQHSASKAVPGAMAAPASAAAPAASAAPTPAPAASASADGGSAAPGPAQDLEALMPLLAPDISPAWRELGQLWHLDSGAKEPCQAAASAQLQCYRTAEMNIPLLRQLDRPGILLLQNGDGPAGYAVLTGLDDQTATLRLGGQLHRVTLMSLARFWRGDFATYWLLPPGGYRSELREGLVSMAYGQLSRQLALLEGKPASPGAAVAQPLDAALVARVKAFQKGQGIKPDGHPGPMTFMQIDKALGVAGPSLEAGSR
jgi:general secretion pathway protein A